jgi:hypothetical protein
MWCLKQIPQIAHFYWGGSNLSYLRYLSVKSFEQLNPDWQIQVHMPAVSSTTAPTWHTHEQQQSNIEQDWAHQLPDLRVEIVQHDFDSYGFDNQAHEVHKSDFLRWKILHEVGGLWSDIDILYTDPMNNLAENLKENSKLKTGLCPLIPPQKHTVGFMLGSQGNTFYRAMHEQCLTEYDPAQYQCIGNALFAPYKSLEEFQAAFPKNHFAFLNKNCVYSISAKAVDSFYQELTHIVRKRMKNPNILGYHWFAGHPVSQQFENEFTPDTLANYDNLITEIIKTKGFDK